MADDWDRVTKIGKNVRGPGGSERETVVRGKGALNAAQRSGAIIGTEKKFAAANTKSTVEGQHLTKVDRSDDIVKPETVGMDVAQALMKARNEMKKPDGKSLTQAELATKCNVDKAMVAEIEKGAADKAKAQQALGKLERVLNVKLRGSGIGQAKFPVKK